MRNTELVQFTMDMAFRIIRGEPYGHDLTRQLAELFRSDRHDAPGCDHDAARAGAFCRGHAEWKRFSC